ncbi:hypothetical protein D3C80_2159020 [compost metagenome]
MLAIQAQQGGGIAWQQLAKGFQQAPVAFAVRQLAGQVGHQGEEGGEQRVTGHFDSLMVIVTAHGIGHYDS